MIFHIIFGATVTGTLIHFWLTRSQSSSTERVVEVSLLYLLCVQWGFGAAFLAISHIISDQVAEFIGWAPGSPFQVELGFVSLGLALVGILCIWIRGWFWLAPVITQTVFCGEPHTSTSKKLFCTKTCHRATQVRSYSMTLLSQSWVVCYFSFTTDLVVWIGSERRSSL